MKQQEKELFKSLCSFKADAFDESLLAAATPTVLGYLFFNRMQAVAYGTLMKHGLLGKVNREFRNSLRGAYEQNVEKNKSFLKCVQDVEDLLSGSKYKYAMLKGALLCSLYPEGYRTSNDIDLLVCPEDVTQIGEVLKKAGFKQGNVRNGEFVPATRAEIIESRMTRGEVVPYIKEVDLPGMRFLEIDINFSLDYKPEDTQSLEKMLEETKVVQCGNNQIRTLQEEDFFVHLCSHLYKEATTLPWVQMMRDMTMYKYCDIYMLLHDASEEWVRQLFIQARRHEMEAVCAFCVMHMSQLFDFKNRYAITVAEKVMKFDPLFIHAVFSPKEEKKYIFTEKNIAERFFADDRQSLLREEEIYEDIKHETQ